MTLRYIVLESPHFPLDVPYMSYSSRLLSTAAASTKRSQQNSTLIKSAQKPRLSHQEAHEFTRRDIEMLCTSLKQVLSNRSNASSRNKAELFSSRDMRTTQALHQTLDAALDTSSDLERLPFTQRLTFRII